MSHLKILQSYAKRSPESFPASILFGHSAKNITIFDGFPKSKFHFLVLPRASETDLSLSDLGSLHALLKADKSKAKEVVAALADDARGVRGDIEREMVKHYGFKWDVWTGFHAAPSMVHLHLHVLSADLCSDKLKHKKHYNSFHPKLGFFLHLDDVLSWFDAEPTYYEHMVSMKKLHLLIVLKEGLTCFHCYKEMKNIPILKDHLQEEWDKLATKASRKRKRKGESADVAVPEEKGLSDQEKTLKRAKSEATENVEA
ncbi:hypothetical protein HYPSUDRAFT_142540 [Hypholoma sublateritium FD-334 SS-4]|uniref:Aprataxin C2HE/C2H2/C2HC zinc finger domain-containing protein n=1 Tax=Hypholoma sublateritium (strain FD-334 SS-4) TaxID=945553 RepID=A0A0D2NUK9_HYPSF|nr:hypothetical protein HYPSUDRAFT_142540 [Hypholoma sublateritium FD-334 SS-4]